VTAAPCPTCRHEVDHLIVLDLEIAELRAKAHTHRWLRAELAYLIGRNVQAARKATRRHRKHRREEHRAAIGSLAEHLLEHAKQPRAAA
jgi:hypothetical protein